MKQLSTRAHTHQINMRNWRTHTKEYLCVETHTQQIIRSTNNLQCTFEQIDRLSVLHVLIS